MKILLTGATGFVGQHLTRELAMAGHALVILSRSRSRAARIIDVPCEIYEWNPITSLVPKKACEGIDAVINMMGENVAGGRWTEGQKRGIYESRVVGTHNLVESLDKFLERPLKALISFSGAHYYPASHSAGFDESSKAGDSFLATVTKDWEEAALRLEKTRKKTILRLGTVVGWNGGVIKKLAPIFKCGLGGPIGNGEQLMSWIHLADLSRLVVHALEDEAYSGVINAVAPEAVSNRKFSKTLGSAFNRPSLLPAPKMAVGFAYGEMSQIVLESQNVISKRLPELGFVYSYPNIEDAVAEACGLLAIGLKGEKQLCERIETFCYFDQSIESCFNFFCDPQNLEKITPPMLNFRIERMDSDPITRGTVIDYRLRLRGIPMRWTSLIKEWEPLKYFVDFQVSGPYKLWNHLHAFYPYGTGTLMRDRVDYALPFGQLGRSLGLAMVRSDLKKIFDYRREHIKILLGKDSA